MTQSNSDKAPLDEVMMAMDVVDTLRHQQLLVDRELNSSEREQKLIERLRQLYASQGIDVPDSILAEGVKALEEDRFTYQPPPHGLQTRLARLYINRGRWGKRLGILATALVVLWGGWYMVVKAPENRRVSSLAGDFNSQAQLATTTLQQAKDKLQRLRAALEAPAHKVSAELATTIAQARERASGSLDEAALLIRSVEEMNPLRQLDRESYQQQVAAMEKRLQQRQDIIGKAEAELNQAETIIDNLATLANLPAELAAERDAVKQIARVKEAGDAADRHYQIAMSALRTGDIETAAGSYATLKNLRRTLASSFTLRVVSRPGEKSGVWRYPEDNASVKNYYLIVEAVDSAGKAMTLPVMNEEDGKTYNVSKWGLRVPQSVYQRVAADKQDDGIIQAREVGAKKIGRLEPDYSISTTGAMITSW